MTDCLETTGVSTEENFLFLTRAGIDTHQEPVVYMREDCHVCRSEGFSAQSRVRVCVGERSIIATLNIVRGDFLSHQKAALSESAWQLLGAKEGDKARFKHAPPVESMSHVRGKLYGKPFTLETARAIITDISQERYSDIQLAAYVTACASTSLSLDETIAITRAMVECGQRFDWGSGVQVLDKHCVGGLPGNRTTPIVVAIVAANGLLMPKTSSRAITSPAGTADTMETLTNVTLSFEQMRAVVNEQGACLAWGGSVALSPTDDIIIRVERALDLDSEGQLVASVISKKIAAGSSHVLIDIPVGPTAKVRSPALAERLGQLLTRTGEALGLAGADHSERRLPACGLRRRPGSGSPRCAGRAAGQGRRAARSAPARAHGGSGIAGNGGRLRARGRAGTGSADSGQWACVAEIRRHLRSAGGHEDAAGCGASVSDTGAPRRHRGAVQQSGDLPTGRSGGSAQCTGSRP